MKLQSTLTHMAGQSVKVNGNTYQLDADGVVDIKDKKDLAKLQANPSGWKSYVKRAPVTAKKVEKTPPPPPPPEEEPEEVETPEELEEKPEVPDGGADPEGTPDAENSEAEEEDEFPDPKMSMTLDTLRTMASAYQVPYDDKTTKRVLVNALMEAMYPEKE